MTSLLHSHLAKTSSRPTATPCNDAKRVIHALRKCLIVMQPLVCEKLDKFIDQDIIVPVEEPTDWGSSLAYLWKANGKL